MARMKSAQTVYYGPAYSGYPSVGSVSANESVNFLWMEEAWCYIRYGLIILIMDLLKTIFCFDRKLK